MAHDHMGHMDMDGMEHNTPSLLTSSPTSMDHSQQGEMSMDHSQHNMGGEHMMSMYFHLGCTETILFSFWKIDSIGGLIGSMIGIFLMAMLYEGLKVLREYLLQRTLIHEPSHPHHHRLDNGNGLRTPLGGGNDTPDGSSTNETSTKTFLRPHPFSFSHTLQTVLHMVQIFISYLLMLIFMTYNVWLSLAVILGAGVGYFVFGWRKRTIVDINEHCH